MSDDGPTVAQWEAILVHFGTGSYGKTAAELVRRGWTDDEVRDLLYPALQGIERRLLDRTLTEARDDQLAKFQADYERLVDAGTPLRRGRPRPTADSSAPLELVTEDYLSLEEIEAERLRLALAGRPHGYDSLAKVLGKNSRTTIVTRYKDREPPGHPIPGVCESAPPHTHGEGRRPG